jgi:hypothetical protein
MGIFLVSIKSVEEIQSCFNKSRIVVVAIFVFFKSARPKDRKSH